jgi:ribosomal protein S18 acetylase RimI-like enzyme
VAKRSQTGGSGARIDHRGTGRKANGDLRGTKPTPKKTAYRPSVLAPGVKYDRKRNAAVTPKRKVGVFSGGVPKQPATVKFRRKDKDYWTGHRARVKLSRDLLHRQVKAGQHAERWAPRIEGKESSPDLMARGNALRALMNTRGGVMQRELRKQERVARDMFAPFPIKGAGPVQRAQRARRDNLAPLMAAQNLSRRADAGIARQKGKADTQKSVHSLRVWKSIKQDLGEFPGEGWGRRRQRQAYEDAVRRFKASQPKAERRGWFDNAAHNATRAVLGGFDETGKGVGAAVSYLSGKAFAGGGAGGYNSRMAMTGGGQIAYATPKITEAYRTQGTELLGGLANYPVQAVPSAYYFADAVKNGRSGELWESFKKDDPLGALVVDLNPKRAGEIAANNPSTAFVYMMPYVGVGRALGAATRAGARSRVMRGGERTFAPYFQLDKDGKKVRGPSVTFKGSKAGTRVADLLGRIGRESRTGQANYRGERAPGVAPDAEKLMTHSRKYSANLLTKGAQVLGEKARNQAIARFFVPLREKRRAELDSATPPEAKAIHQSINRINDVIDLLDPDMTSGVMRGHRQRRFAATMSEVAEKVRGVRITQFNERLGKILRQHLGDGVFARWHGSKAPKAALAIMADVVQYLPADASRTRAMWQKRRDDLEGAQTFEKGQSAPPTPEQLNNARAVAAYDELLALPADKFDAEVARARAVREDVRPIQAEFEQWAMSEGIMRPNEPNARYIPAAVAQFGDRFRHDPTEREVKPFDKSSNDYQELLDTAEVATMRAGGLEASLEPLGRLIQQLRDVTAAGFWRSQDETGPLEDLTKYPETEFAAGLEVETITSALARSDADTGLHDSGRWKDVGDMHMKFQALDSSESRVGYLVVNVNGGRHREPGVAKPGPRTIDVLQIKVLPQFRNQGVATRLMRELNARFPDTPIRMGELTDDGTVLVGKVLGGAEFTLGGKPYKMPAEGDRVAPTGADLHLTVDKAMKQVQKLAANGQIDEAGTLIRNLREVLSTHEDPAGMLNTGILRQESRLQLNDAIGRVNSIERQVKAKKDLAAKCKKEMVAMQENSGEKMVRMDFKLDGAPISLARLGQILTDPAMADLHGINPILDPMFISHQFELSDQPGTFYKPMTANPTLGPSRTGESFRTGAAETGIEAVPASMRHTMTRATMAQNIRMVLEGIGYGLETRFTEWKEANHHLESLQRDTGTKWILLSKTKLTKLNIQIDDLLARVHGDVSLLNADAGDFETLHHLAKGTKVQEGTDFGDGIDLIAVPAEAWKQFEKLQTGGTLTRHQWGQTIVFLNTQFKRTVLPLSPMYYVGNVVDNWMRVLLSGALKPQAWLDAAAIIREVYASENPSETLARLIPAQFMRSIDNSRVSSTVSRALEGRRPRGNELSVKGGAHSTLRGILVGWDRTTSALMQLNEIFAEGGGATRGGRAHPKAIRKGTAGIPFYSIGPTVLAAAIVHRRLLTEIAQDMDDFHRIGAKALAAKAVGKTAESQTYLAQSYNLIQEILGRYDGETAGTKVLLRTVLPFFQFGRNAMIFTYFTFPFQHPFAFSVVMNLEAILQEELQDAGNTQDALNRDSPKEVRNREGVRIAPNQRIDLTRFTSFSAGVNPFMTLQSFGGPLQGALYAAGPGVKWNGQTIRGDFGAVSNTQRADEALNSLLGSLFPGYALAGRIVRGGESASKPGLAGYWKKGKPRTGDGISNAAWWKMLGLPRKYYDDPTGRNIPSSQQTPEQFRRNYIDPPQSDGVDLNDPNLPLDEFLRELRGPPSRQGQ